MHTKQQFSAILAGLRLLQASLDNRTVYPNDANINDILTDGGTHQGMTSAEIDSLCEEINFGGAQPTVVCDMADAEKVGVSGENLVTQLAALKQAGLTFSQVVEVFGVGDADPYVKAARDLTVEGGVEVDDLAIVSLSENGAYVSAWLWVGSDDAGLMEYPALWELVLDHAREVLDDDNDLDEATEDLRECQADWLDNLVSEHSEDFASIEDATPVGEPRTVTWLDAEFLPSEALRQILGLARTGGLEDKAAEQAEAFCAKYGSKLDTIVM